MKVIRPHDPSWKGLFAAEAQMLWARLDRAALEIHHIGSTAIPGIVAKPIIDILVEARSLEEIDALAPIIEEIGYEARGEHGIPDRRYFKKQVGASGVGFHTHIFAQGSEHIAKHVRFRDFLLLKPAIAQDYSKLKQRLASPSGVLSGDYAARKAAFIRRIHQLAERYYAQDEN